MKLFLISNSPTCSFYLAPCFLISHLAPFNCTFSVQGRLKMDPTSGLGRCVSLVVYSNEDEARTCVKVLKN